MAFLPSPLLTFPSASVTHAARSYSRLPFSRPNTNVTHSTKRARSHASNPKMLSSSRDVRTKSDVGSDLHWTHNSDDNAWPTLLASALGDAPAPPQTLWFTQPVDKKRNKKSLEKGDESRPNRKPHGFWNDFANLERELMAVNCQLGRPGKKIVPKLNEMRMLGRGDLVAAVGKHGGIRKVAEDLRWGRGGKTRRVVATASSTARRREKVLRRPRKYWQDIDRVKMEIGAFIAEYGVKGVMPTRKQFYKFGRADLVQAAGRHGGVRVLAKQMGLKCRRAARSSLYWKDFKVVKKALLEFSDKHCPGCMPTGDELTAEGWSALTNAIPVHGGFPSVAKKLGLKPRNTRSQGAPNRWDEKRLRMELHAFTMTHFPDLARSQTMPSESQLRKNGRNDLSYAINKFGGYAAVADATGLRMKKHGFFSSRRLGLEGKKGAD
eukprot:GFKZ01005513.1.p1 GENE.GFKZ01005513.1~~GFKZ01005513.1.p1  ORF type:complete len:436 (+),score=43.78 GFKZ01005513.1:242-1549(+)